MTQTKEFLLSSELATVNKKCLLSIFLFPSKKFHKPNCKSKCPVFANGFSYSSLTLSSIYRSN